MQQHEQIQGSLYLLKKHTFFHTMFQHINQYYSVLKMPKPLNLISILFFSHTQGGERISSHWEVPSGGCHPGQDVRWVPDWWSLKLSLQYFFPQGIWEREGEETEGGVHNLNLGRNQPNQIKNGQGEALFTCRCWQTVFPWTELQSAGPVWKPGG